MALTFLYTGFHKSWIYIFRDLEYSRFNQIDFQQKLMSELVNYEGTLEDLKVIVFFVFKNEQINFRKWWPNSWRRRNCSEKKPATLCTNGRIGRGAGLAGRSRSKCKPFRLLSFCLFGNHDIMTRGLRRKWLMVRGPFEQIYRMNVSNRILMQKRHQGCEYGFCDGKIKF